MRKYKQKYWINIWVINLPPSLEQTKDTKKDKPYFYPIQGMEFQGNKKLNGSDKIRVCLSVGKRNPELEASSLPSIN